MADVTGVEKFLRWMQEYDRREQESIRQGEQQRIWREYGSTGNDYALTSTMLDGEYFVMTLGDFREVREALND